MEGKIPIGVLRQTSHKPNTLYKIWGLAKVIDWNNGYFVLEGLSLNENKKIINFFGGRSLNFEEGINDAITKGMFDPENIEDARKRIAASIVQRRGQPAFRKALLNNYANQCTITHCNVIEVLEAAHTIPYLGDDTNHPSNGILLRADLHTLFDNGLIAIEPDNLTVYISSKIRNSYLEGYHGKQIYIPDELIDRPNLEALQQKWDLRLL